MEDKIIDIRLYDELTELFIAEFSYCKTRDERKDVIDSLLDTLIEMEIQGNQADIKTLVMRSGNIYCKSVYVPKGTLLVGEKYRVQQINNCLYGAFHIFDEQKGAFSISQGDTFISPRWTRRAAYAIENSMFQSIYEVPSTYQGETLEEYINSNIYKRGE